MALFRGSIRSDVLKMDTTVNVIFPEAHYVAPKTENRTLILLHGLKQNADTWQRMSRVESYVHPANFNVIIPEVQRSWYADMAYGINYFRYIAEELPEMMGRMFRIPMDRDHLFAAGLSMGGYGAVKCALTYPDRFAGAMSFSGALSILENPDAMMTIMSREELMGIIGPDLRCGDEQSLARLAGKAAASVQKPRLYIACGTEDALIGDNRNMALLTRDLGFDIVFEEWPGHHDWEFWDRALVRGMSVMTGLDANEINPLYAVQPMKTL